MTEFDFNVKDDLVTKYVSVSLHDTPHYRTKFNLASVQVIMLCGYNTRNKMRWIILTDAEGDPLLTQTFIKYGKRCELNFVANQHDLNYYVTLKAKDKTKKFTEGYDYLNWSKDFDICFVGYEYSLVERLDSNLRKVLVGN